MRKIAIRMAGLVFYMAAGFVLLFWKLERGGLHNAELLLPLAWLAGRWLWAFDWTRPVNRREGGERLPITFSLP